MFTSQELLRFASRDYILGNTTVEEQAAFIEDQIQDPFNSGGNNYFKKLSKMVSSKDEMDELCKRFFTLIQDVYPNLTIDIDDYNQRLEPLFSAVYKVFVKNVNKLMYIFIRQFIYNNKNRKGLIAEFSGTKISTYPKEQFGNKNYYILITKLDQIVDAIFQDGVKLKKFLEYVEKGGVGVYVDYIQSAMDAGLIIDDGVVSDMFSLYKESDSFRSDLNTLEMEITQTFIIPYLKDNGMETVWLPQTEIISQDEDEDEDNEDDNDDDWYHLCNKTLENVL